MAVKQPLFDKFFDYARERHQIYLNRAAGKPRTQWTKDPILQQYRFTNVFRELDATTDWFRQKVRDPLRAKPEVLLATVLFRMLNRILVGEAIFCQTVMGPKSKTDGQASTAWEYYLRLRKVPLLRNAITTFVGKQGPYVTGAYIISTPPGYDKLSGVLHIVDQFERKKCERKDCRLKDWECLANTLLENRGQHTLQQVFDWLGGFPYLGTFHSYEIVTDLRHTELLDKAPDILTWANMGPGARRGLNRIYGRGRAGEGRDVWGASITTGQALDEMRELLRCSRDAKYWPQAHKTTAEGAAREGLWPKWELRDVEHTLCEFDKYNRVLNGEGKPRGVFR